MRKTSLFVLFVVAFLIATPALAGDHSPTGIQLIAVPQDPPTFPADTAFYVKHGWWTGPEYVPGQWSFELEVDGVYLKPTYTEYETYVVDGEVYFRRSWIFNFPDGMTGTHIFHSHWIAPCEVAPYYDIVVDCPNPNADLEIYGFEFPLTFE